MRITKRSHLNVPEMSEAEANDAPKDYFATQKRILKWAGISFEPKQSWLFKLYSIFPVLLLASFPMLLFWDCVNPPYDLNDIITNVFYGTGVSTAMAKHVVVLVKRIKMRKIMDALENAPYLHKFKYREASETQLIKNYIAFGKKSTIAGVTLGVYAITFTMFLIVIITPNKEVRALPFGKISILLERFKYEAVFAYEGAAMFYTVFSYLTCDILYATILMFVCVQCTFLQNFINRMGEISYTMMTRDKKVEYTCTGEKNELKLPAEWKYLQEMLREAVSYHIAIFHISKEAEDAFNFIILTVFTSMSFCSCCIMYHASMYPLTDSHFMEDVVMCITVLTPLFILSYWGNEVIIQSQAIADACYKINFIGTDIRFQKGLMLIIQRSQRPITFTIGKFATVSMPAIVSFCRACYSYYMVLHKSNEE